MHKLFSLLEYIPCINSLTIPRSAVIQSHNLSEYEIKIIDKLSQENSIKKVTIVGNGCTLKQLQFLFKLCLNIEYLSIGLLETSDDLIIRFLISKINEKNSHLFFLCLTRWNINNDLLAKIQSIINPNYSLELFQGNIYLWC